nr:glycosyltransferase family 39 protein [Chromobacterium sp. ASV5]
MPHIPRRVLPPDRYPALPAWLFCCLCLAWLLPGLLGHEPWKPDEAYTFGLVRHIAASGDWVVPTLAGEPFLEKPPLFFISASLLLQWLTPWLAPPDAARLAAGLWMAIAFVGLALAARNLFGRHAGRWAVILLLGCVGLPLRAHQMITDTALLAGFCWGIAGLSMARRRPLLAGVLLGAGGAAAFLSKGLLGPGCLGLTALLLPLHRHYRNRDYLKTLLAALIVGLPLPALWGGALYLRDPTLFWTWLDANNLGRFNGHSGLGPKAHGLFYTRTLPWYGFPALPLALWALWLAWKRRLPFSADRLLTPGLTLLVTLAVLASAADARELYALPILPPLVLLAASALPAAEGADWRWASRAALAYCLLMLAFLLAVAWALSSGQPAALAAHLLPRLFGGWTPGWHPWTWLAFGAILLLVARAWRLRPARGVQGFVWRWSLSQTLLWGTLATLWLPALDHGMRYRDTFVALAPTLRAIEARGDCVASRQLGEPQRALLEYYAGFRTLRLETRPEAKRCGWLLLQTLHDALPDPLPGELVLSTQRPGDHKERFYLFRLDKPA